MSGVPKWADLFGIDPTFPDEFADHTPAPCRACGAIPQSWRQPRVPRSVTETAQEQPEPDSAHIAPSDILRRIQAAMPLTDPWGWLQAVILDQERRELGAA